MRETLSFPVNGLIDGAKEHAIDSFCRSFKIDFPDEHLTQVVAAVTDGMTIVFAGNHSGHADLMSMALVVKLVCEKVRELDLCDSDECQLEYPGVVVPMAGTAVTGEQSKDVTTGITIIIPWLNKYGTYPIPIMRERDREYYGSADQGNQTVKVRGLWRRIREGYGLGIMVSGTVQESRLNEHGERCGMRLVNEQNFYTLLLTKYRRRNRDVLVVPLGYSDAHQVLDPDTRKVTSRAIRVILVQSLSKRYVPATILAAVRVGKPIMAADIWESMPEGENVPSYLNNFILATIARLIAAEGRGDFTDEVIESYLG